jgi:carboxypeptidase Taq
MSKDAFDQLRARMMTLSDVEGALNLLAWDQQTMMPPNGAAVRAERLATLGQITHEMLVSDETSELLEKSRPYEESLPYDADDAALIRVVRRAYHRWRNIPVDLLTARIRAQSNGYAAWVRARAEDDYAQFQPALQSNLDLLRQEIDIRRSDLPEGGEDYDLLLDDFEPKLPAAEVRAVFDELKAGTVPLVQRVSEHADAVSDAPVRGHFPQAVQREFILGIIKRFGFCDDAWRLDVTHHPFASSMAIDDIRITTRYDESFINMALFGSMHECGHGLYEHGINPAFERTPLADGASMSWHESQSRMWENFVGRSRPFWQSFFPQLQRAFPGQLDDCDADAFYRAVNKMHPSLIRVEADELTYNLHIILRFELEQGMLSGDIPLADLSEAWNARMKDYLGIDVPSNANGVLQDVHWSSGNLGYFPTYALGNVVAAQLWERIRKELPDLDDQFARGEFGSLREWLQTNIYQYGRKYLPKELLQKVLGVDQFDAKPLLRYLTAKVDELYGA